MPILFMSKTRTKLGTKTNLRVRKNCFLLKKGRGRPDAQQNGNLKTGGLLWFVRAHGDNNEFMLSGHSVCL